MSNSNEDDVSFDSGEDQTNGRPGSALMSEENVRFRLIFIVNGWFTTSYLGVRRYKRTSKTD